MRIRSGRIDAEVRYLAPVGFQYAPVRAFAVRATPLPGAEAIGSDGPIGVLEAYPLLDAFRALEDAAGLADFMNERGPLLPVMPNREVVWGLDTLLGELDEIDRVARCLLLSTVGPGPVGPEGSAWSDEPETSDPADEGFEPLRPDVLAARIADGIERLADLQVTTDQRGGAPRLSVATGCLCGLAWLLLGAWAAALGPTELDALEFSVVRCTNDRCRRPYAKVGKIAYCETCRASGADLAYQRRRRYASERAGSATDDGSG